MPTTIKKIAETCGVSKATVRRRLEELDLMGNGHVTKQGQKMIVSDHAASLVAASLADREAAPATPQRQETTSAIHERYIALLEADKARLEAQVAEKDREIAELSRQVAEIASKLASQRKPSIWDRLLPRRTKE